MPKRTKKFSKFGHEIYQNDKGEWLWKDDDTLITNQKLCPKCNKYPLPNDIDPCLGELPGVQGACCGHGVHKGYIWFENGKRLIFNKNTIKI